VAPLVMARRGWGLLADVSFSFLKKYQKTDGDGDNRWSIRISMVGKKLMGLNHHNPTKGVAP
jgi:hypothetical protein